MRFPALLSVVAVASVALTSCMDHSAKSNGRTLTVTANESVTVEPDLAVLHIGFDTPPEDVKSAYADGARRSNAIVVAVKQAGIPEDAIRSEWQYIDRVWDNEHKFRLEQHWTVKVPPGVPLSFSTLRSAQGPIAAGRLSGR